MNIQLVTAFGRKNQLRWLNARGLLGLTPWRRAASTSSSRWPTLPACSRRAKLRRRRLRSPILRSTRSSTRLQWRLILIQRPLPSMWLWTRALTRRRTAEYLELRRRENHHHAAAAATHCRLSILARRSKISNWSICASSGYTLATLALRPWPTVSPAALLRTCSNHCTLAAMRLVMKARLLSLRRCAFGQSASCESSTWITTIGLV